MAMDKKGRPWKPNELAMLGTVSDPAASDILDRKVESVKAARKRRRISSYYTRQRIKKWCNDDLKVFDQHKDTAVAKLLRLNQYEVAWRRAELRGIA